MANDDSKLPRAVLRGEELYVDNDKEPYFRDPDYVIHLDITDLKVAGGLEQSDPMEGWSPKVVVAPGLRGLARLEGRDKFAGAPGSNSICAPSAPTRPVSTERPAAASGSRDRAVRDRRRRCPGGPADNSGGISSPGPGVRAKGTFPPTAGAAV
jgi:hypothetical protein